MIDFLKARFDQVRRWLSRNEWAVRWLHLSRSSGTAHEPGLLLIQIDGLARTQLLRALKRRKMPFLRKLLRKRGYRLATLYSGLPSSTPAVQAELFYGVRGAVPAFSYRDPTTRRIVRMFDSLPAAEMQARLEQQGAGLFQGGSAYSDIYSGGAAESHFCAATMGWGEFLRAVNPLALAGLILWNGWSIVRTLTLMLVECGIALGDFVSGQFARLDLIRELKLIPSRVFVSVGLRELMVIGGSLDVTRGLPIVHVNFLGYDEQAHRRGPSSAFAHFTLEGIDDAIKRLWVAARRSQRRKYSIWIYSDHGQERATPYERRYGRTVQDAVAEVFGQEVVLETDASARGEQTNRAQWLGGRAGKRLVGPAKKRRRARRRKAAPPRTVVRTNGSKPPVEVVSMGPIGHVYPSEQLSSDRLEQIAQALVHIARIPMVLVPAEPAGARAWTRSGVYELPGEAERLLGADHPFLAEAAADLTALCHHASAGQLIICGWSLDRPAVSFALENGAHAGPGTEETKAFALFPREVPNFEESRSYIRPMDLRNAALEWLDRAAAPATPGTTLVPAASPPLAAWPGDGVSCDKATG